MHWTVLPVKSSPAVLVAHLEWVGSISCLMKVWLGLELQLGVEVESRLSFMPGESSPLFAAVSKIWIRFSVS